MNGDTLNIPTEFWRKSKQDGKSWRRSSRLIKYDLSEIFLIWMCLLSNRIKPADAQ